MKGRPPEAIETELGSGRKELRPEGARFRGNRRQELIQTNPTNGGRGRQQPSKRGRRRKEQSMETRQSVGRKGKEIRPEFDPVPMGKLVFIGSKYKKLRK